MERELEALPPSRSLSVAGDLKTYRASAFEIPCVLTEIGRLREIAFRAVGEGTGKATDRDAFDEHYQHLFVWNSRSKEVVGAYRLAGTDVVRDLYTATLFRYGREFRTRLGPALELGRSFVRPEYQRSFQPLLLLWKAIGSYVAANPKYRVLFGPVSISNQYQTISRKLMVSFLERHAALTGWMGSVTSRNRFRSAERNTGLDLDDLSAVVSDLEPGGGGVPVLLRQYLKLGGKLLGFYVDPQFGNSLDGLILVDLTKTEPKLLERYLGKSQSARFLAYQKGNQ
jgi:putative hemolysin